MLVTRFHAFVLSLAAASTAARGGQGVPGTGRDPLTESLRKALREAPPATRLRAYAVLATRPDGAEIEEELSCVERRGRAEHVAAHFRERGAAERRGVVEKLESEAARGRAGRIVDLFLVNVVGFEGTAACIEEVASMPGVLRLGLDSKPTVPTADAADWTVAAPTPPSPPGVVVAPHLVKIGADQCWFAGQVGSGVKVAILDKGIALDHPSLANHLWTNPGEIPGNGLDDDGNGFVDDVHGWNFEKRSGNVTSPGGFDHGTKVAGLVVGDGSLIDTAGTQIVTGVAPDAKILSLVFGDSQVEYWACQQYAILAGVDVILSSHSFKWDPSNFPDYAVFRDLANVELAAGILHVNSVGNQGGDPNFPVPYNIAAPAGCPAPWNHPQAPIGSLASTLAVGAVNLDDGSYAPSSIGPAAWEDVQLTDPGYPHAQIPEYWDYPYAGGTKPGCVKPDLVAPTGVTTTTLSGFYSFNFLGTSASAPQVAGAAALMLGANPELEIRHVAHLLQATALDLGVPSKDVRFGAGRIRVFDAVRRARVSVKPTPSKVPLGGTVAFPCRTLPGGPTVVFLGAQPGFVPIPGVGTIDVAGPLAFLVEGAVSPTAEFSAGALTIPHAPALLGLTFYVQLGVQESSLFGSGWVFSAVDRFTIAN